MFTALFRGHKFLVSFAFHLYFIDTEQSTKQLFFYPLNKIRV